MQTAGNLQLHCAVLLLGLLVIRQDGVTGNKRKLYGLAPPEPK